MLVVNDMNKLPLYGFSKQSWTNSRGRDIWYKTVATGGENDEVQLELVVNPDGSQYADNEIICNVYSSSRLEYEIDYPMDTILQMVADGVVSVIKTDRRVA